MSYRIANQKNTNRTLRLNNEAWYSLLDLAEVYGWNPMGTVLSEAMSGGDPMPGWYGPDELWLGSYTDENIRLVLWEDALNLADALERAFLEYEPVFVHMVPEGPLELCRTGDYVLPSIGVLLEVMELCREGAFWVERT